MNTPYSPAAIANVFLEKSGTEGKPLTPMQLLKLVYIAHGWYLAGAGEALIDEPVQAWKYGPVVPSLFHEFKRYGGSPIGKLASSAPTVGDDDFYRDDDLSVSHPFVPPSDDHATALLGWVWTQYGSISAWALSDKTHAAGTPWYNAVQRMKQKHGGWVPNFVIENSEIREHYLDLWKQRYVASTAGR